MSNPKITVACPSSDRISELATTSVMDVLGTVEFKRSVKIAIDDQNPAVDVSDHQKTYFSGHAAGKPGRAFEV